MPTKNSRLHKQNFLPISFGRLVGALIAQVPTTSRALLASLAYCICACSPSNQDQTASLQAFADAFQAANEAATISPLLELYCLEGVDKDSIRMLKAALSYELGLEIQDISFQNLSGAPEETIRYHHNGVLYGPNLKPEMRMLVEYATEDRFTSHFTLGIDSSNNWKIISSRPQKTE